MTRWWWQLPASCDDSELDEYFDENGTDTTDQQRGGEADGERLPAEPFELGEAGSEPDGAERRGEKPRDVELGVWIDHGPAVARDESEGVRSAAGVAQRADACHQHEADDEERDDLVPRLLDLFRALFAAAIEDRHQRDENRHAEVADEFDGDGGFHGNVGLVLLRVRQAGAGDLRRVVNGGAQENAGLLLAAAEERVGEERISDQRDQAKDGDAGD